MKRDLATLCLDQRRTIRDAIALLDVNRLGIILVVDAEGRLVGTVTDGDVRRAVLACTDLAGQVATLLTRKAGPYKSPITARCGQEPQSYLRLLRQHNILHLPLLDKGGRVVGLIRMDDFVPDQMPSLQAVIMAGGSGTRLRPLTEETPKPMLQVGDRPLMEIIINQLRQSGIGRVHVTMHHQPGKITEHFGDGQDFGVELTYVTEEQPLGTAGALGLMDPRNETLLVINGDILTQVDFRAMLAYHREHRADLTVAVRPQSLNVPYGVVECEGPKVVRVVEKPVISHFVNAGIYLIEPCAHRLIPPRQRFDMPDLIQRLLDRNRPVAGFPIREYWVDIGRQSDYAQAQAQVKQWAAEFVAGG